MWWFRLIPAVYAGDIAEVKRLVEQGADVDATDAKGNPVLLISACSGHLDVVMYLVEQGADKETKGNDGHTALLYAALNRRLDVVKYLVEQGADKEAKNNDGDTALLIALLKNRLNVVKCLVFQGANSNAMDTKGQTALVKVIQLRDMSLLETFLTSGADLSLLDNDGSSALINLLQMEGGEEDQILPIVKLMLELGVPPILSNKYGISAKPIAMSKRVHYVVALIDEYAVKPRPRQAEPEPENPSWYIAPNTVTRDDAAVADGGFGTVYRAEWMEANVAKKEIKIQSKDHKEKFLEEVKLWCDLRHPNVVPFYGANHREPPFFIVSKFAEEGTLCDYLGKENRRQTVVWQKLFQVAAGLNYLHGKKVIHGNLKGNNIVVNDRGTAMLTDFGLSFLDGGPYSMKNELLGAMHWRAPEYERDTLRNPSKESDMYSLGMCIIEAVTGGRPRTPWPCGIDYQTIQCYRRGEIVIEELPGMTSVQWNLVKRMTAYKREDRPNMSDVIKLLKEFAVEEECPF